MSGSSGVRVDAWLWAVRVFKSRSLAAAACKAGHVRLNGERAKPSSLVRIGDEVVVRADRERILEVRELLVKRVSAPLATAAVIDRSPPPPPPGVFEVPRR